MERLWSRFIIMLKYNLNFSDKYFLYRVQYTWHICSIYAKITQKYVFICFPCNLYTTILQHYIEIANLQLPSSVRVPRGLQYNFPICHTHTHWGKFNRNQLTYQYAFEVLVKLEKPKEIHTSKQRTCEQWKCGCQVVVLTTEPTPHPKMFTVMKPCKGHGKCYFVLLCHSYVFVTFLRDLLFCSIFDWLVGHINKVKVRWSLF